MSSLDAISSHETAFQIAAGGQVLKKRKKWYQEKGKATTQKRGQCETGHREVSQKKTGS